MRCTYPGLEFGIEERLEEGENKIKYPGLVNNVEGLESNWEISLWQKKSIQFYMLYFCREVNQLYLQQVDCLFRIRRREIGHVSERGALHVQDSNAAHHLSGGFGDSQFSALHCRQVQIIHSSVFAAPRTCNASRIYSICANFTTSLSCCRLFFPQKQKFVWCKKIISQHKPQFKVK